jgi:hypothetical protein
MAKPPQTIDVNNTNVIYTISDEPLSESEWVERFVTEVPGSSLSMGEAFRSDGLKG